MKHFFISLFIYWFYYVIMKKFFFFGNSVTLSIAAIAEQQNSAKVKKIAKICPFHMPPRLFEKESMYRIDIVIVNRKLFCN